MHLLNLGTPLNVLWVVEGSELCHGCWWWLMLTPPVESWNAWSLDLCILVCREPSFCFTLWDNSVTWALQISRFIITVNTKIYFFINKLIVSRRKLCFFCYIFWNSHESSEGLCKTRESVFWGSLNLEVIYNYVTFCLWGKLKNM